jgi:hypothetical protein
LSSLPPVGLTCRNGHPFSTTAKAGQSIPCPGCGVSVWIGKYARGRQAAVRSPVPARPAVVKANGRSAGVVVRRPVPAPRLVQPERQVLAEDDGASRGDMAVMLAQLLGGLVAGKPGAVAGGTAAAVAVRAKELRAGRVVEGVVILPGEPAETEAAPRRRRHRAELAFGGALQPAAGRACDMCQFDDRRTQRGYWPAARYEAELRAAERHHALLCGNCLRQLEAQGVVICSRELPDASPPRPGEIRRPAVLRGGAAGAAWCGRCGSERDPVVPDACPCGRRAWVSRGNGGAGRAGSRLQLPASRPSPNRGLVSPRVYG